MTKKEKNEFRKLNQMLIKYENNFKELFIFVCSDHLDENINEWTKKAMDKKEELRIIKDEEYFLQLYLKYKHYSNFKKKEGDDEKIARIYVNYIRVRRNISEWGNCINFIIRNYTNNKV